MNLPCYLVRDLLPLYKDQVCDAQTAADLHDHLESCPQCRAALQALAEGAPEAELAQAGDREAAAALADIRSDLRRRRRLLLLAAALLCVLAVAATVLLAWRQHMLDTDVPFEGAGQVAEVRQTPQGLLSARLFAPYGIRTIRVRDYELVDKKGREEGRVILFALSTSAWSRFTTGKNQPRLLDTEAPLYNDPEVSRAYLIPWEMMQKIESSRVPGGAITAQELAFYEAELVWAQD